jgi:two-component sensor histidine kinase
VDDQVGSSPVPARRRRRFRSAARTPTEARRFVERTVDALVTVEDRFALSLVVGEITTNAVLHGEEPIDIALAVAGNVIRVEVQDASPVLPRVTDPTPLGGFGMHVVANCADAWGAHRVRDGGKIVWAEIRNATGPGR